MQCPRCNTKMREVNVCSASAFHGAESVNSLITGFSCEPAGCGHWIDKEVTPKQLNTASRCYITEQKKTGDYLPTKIREEKKVEKVNALLDKHFDFIQNLFSRGYMLKEVMAELKKICDWTPGDRYLLIHYRKRLNGKI